MLDIHWFWLAIFNTSNREQKIIRYTLDDIFLFCFFLTSQQSHTIYVMFSMFPISWSICPLIHLSIHRHQIRGVEREKRLRHLMYTNKNVLWSKIAWPIGTVALIRQYCYWWILNWNLSSRCDWWLAHKFCCTHKSSRLCMLDEFDGSEPASVP